MPQILTHRISSFAENMAFLGVEIFTDAAKVEHMTAASVEIRFPAKVGMLARDIKISHTIFAMPWAILSAFAAAEGMPRAGVLILIVVCMIAARTVAMAANRLLDVQIDLRNPRTAGRAIPSGKLSTQFVAKTMAVCAVVFIAATSLFWVWYSNPLPLALSLPLLAFLSAYPLIKRVSAICHFYLGVALALAPICAWVAVRGDVTVTPLLIAGAVFTWTAGFDIIYGCQDYASDVAEGIHSVPASLGIAGALWLSRGTHIVSVVFMIAAGSYEPQLTTLYFSGVALAALLLIIEQSLVSPCDLSKAGLAFFTMNGIISLVVGTLGIVDVLRCSRQ